MSRIQLGVNLSFCVKRWVTPQLWAPVVRDRLGLDLVQFSFDLVDPMWPDDLLKELAEDLRTIPAKHGITVHSCFIGLAHYTYNQLLHPNPRVRDVAEHWLARAYKFAVAAGITKVGGPLGAIASRIDGIEADQLPETDYQDLVARAKRLSVVAKEAGITELFIEPTPLRRECPWTIEQNQRLADDLRGAAVPWKFCIDWGHATFEPVYGRYRGTMESWFRALQPEIGMVHMQQTDYQYDRHWDFTNPEGRVDPREAADLVRNAGLADRPIFLEVFYPFERDDASILEAMGKSMALLKDAYGIAPPTGAKSGIAA